MIDASLPSKLRRNMMRHSRSKKHEKFAISEFLLNEEREDQLLYSNVDLEVSE